MAILPRDSGLTGSQLQLLKGEGPRGTHPLIPPSQALIRLQMADGPRPSPTSMTKAGRGLPIRPWSLSLTAVG